jgi:hypothetical protein
VRKLPLPSLRVEPVLQSCATSIQDTDLATRLTDAGAELSGAEDDYLLKGPLGTIYQTLGTSAAGKVTAKEMIGIYDGTLARRGSKPRRQYYDILRSSAPHQICPFCFQRTVSSLDHFLPKVGHPRLALTPANLIPCCADCNKWKSTKEGASEGQYILHPYFDDVDDDIWLFATVIQGDPPGMTFEAKPPSDWLAEKRLRTVSHFAALHLNELFSSRAGRLIANICLRTSELFKAGGRDAVSEHLAAEARSRRILAKNSWEIAAYDALSKSDYFCSYQHS